MARPAPPDTRRTKTESLSLRLDPKTKFILEFVARINGQSITTVVERAIRAAADGVKLTEYDPGSEQTFEQNWQNFWDVNEGVRTLKLLAASSYPTNFEEDELREFTHAHYEFFYTTREKYTPRRPYVEILWPEIQRYLQTWRESQRKNYWLAGMAMKEALLAADISAPEWPRPSTQAAKPVTQPTATAKDLDDEIPF